MAVCSKVFRTDLAARRAAGLEFRISKLDREIIDRLTRPKNGTSCSQWWNISMAQLRTNNFQAYEVQFVMDYYLFTGMSGAHDE